MAKYNLNIVEGLYTAWRAAEAEANRIYYANGDNCAHPAYIAAAQRSQKELAKFLAAPACTPRGLLLKLCAADYFEDFLTDTRNPACTAVAPHILATIMLDLAALDAKTE